MLSIPTIILLLLLIAATYSSYRKAILPHELTLGGAVVGAVLSVIFPESLGTESRMAALGTALSGFFVGLFTAWMLIELGKLAFGKVKHQFEEPLPWSVTQPDDDQPPVVNVGDEAYGWADLFTRRTDCVILDCPTVYVSGLFFKNARAALMMETISVTSDGGKEERFRLESVTALSGTTTKIEIPREAMGFGVAMLSAMTGAFVGPKLAACVFGGALLLLCLVIALHACSTRKRGAGRMEVAPFMLLSCIIFLALRHLAIL